MKKNWRAKDCERKRQETEKEREESIFTVPSSAISALWQKCQKIERTADKMNSLNLCVWEWMMGDERERERQWESGLPACKKKAARLKPKKEKDAHGESECGERKMEAKPAG